MSDKKTVRLTGAWERSGQFGSFSVGTVKLTELNEALATLGNPDVFELVISPAEKKSESSPDFNINLRPKMAKMEGGAGGKTQAPRAVGGERKVSNTRRF